MNGSHQQRGRDALAADIARRQDELVGIQRQKVVVVAAHGPRGAADSMEFERFKLRDFARKQLRLHFLRNDEFVLQPLFLLLF